MVGNKRLHNDAQLAWHNEEQLQIVKDCLKMLREDQGLQMASR